MTTTFEAPDVLGACPDCGRVDGYLNAGKTHRAYCSGCRPPDPGNFAEWDRAGNPSDEAGGPENHESPTHRHPAVTRCEKKPREGSAS